MEKVKLFSLLMFLTPIIFSQESKFSIEANIPVAIEDNFLANYYNGVVDVGAKFRVLQLKNIDFGASLNSGLFSTDIWRRNGHISNIIDAYSIQSIFFTELKFKTIPKLKPILGIGYTSFIFRQIQNQYNLGYINNSGGLNLNFGFSYYLTDKLFLQSQYDFIKIAPLTNTPEKKYNTHLSMLKFGIGFRC